MWLCIITQYKGEYGALWEPSEFHMDAKKYKYKGITKMRITIMEHVYIYKYVSFTLGVLFLIGLILFMWVVLQKIQSVLHRWVIGLIDQFLC
jgi:hypothetical protein